MKQKLSTFCSVVHFFDNRIFKFISFFFPSFLNLFSLTPKITAVFFFLAFSFFCLTKLLLVSARIYLLCHRLFITMKRRTCLHRVASWNLEGLQISLRKSKFDHTHGITRHFQSTVVLK